MQKRKINLQVPGMNSDLKIRSKEEKRDGFQQTDTWPLTAQWELENYQTRAQMRGEIRSELLNK